MPAKRISVSDRLREDARPKLGVEALFQTPAAPTPLPAAAASQPVPRYTRKTFHIRLDQVKAVRRYAFEQELDISEVVRRALDAFLARPGP